MWKLKGSNERDCHMSVERHVAKCSTKVWLLPNSERLFFNISNAVTSSPHQYLESTREQWRSSLSCVSADVHSWRVPYRARNGEAPLQGLFQPGALFPLPAAERGLVIFQGISSWSLWASREDVCSAGERAGLICTPTHTPAHVRTGQQL